MSPWYAIRLFTNQQEAVCLHLADKGLECFIPKEYVDYETPDGHRQHRLCPVVRNLLFVKKSLDEADMRQLFTETPYPLSVFRKETNATDYYEIPPLQMQEFQMMCQPERYMAKYISEELAQHKEGTPVLVKHGPLRGLTGRLVRSSKRYYLLKEVPGLAVMLKVSRWCCQPLTAPLCKE